MLTGELVTLRPVRRGDYEQLYAWRTDIATWMDTSAYAPVPWTFEAFTEYYDRIIREAKEALDWAVEVDGTLVGRCGMFDFNDLSRHAEVGLSYGPEHRGKGYGRDTLRVLLRYAFVYRNLHRVHLETTATNTAALRCYAAVGFVEEGRLREHAYVDGRYVDMVVMSVLRSEWAE